ncbi:peptide synthetase [Streptomyces triticagri]|uniref:Peptide synthetase n=1 Tax=Streptomyces triticagri TaxID=2293568 RepID=A0A372M1D7_9ACTN|nr:peptide synthetase [Streptomyces triticagri]RFU84400.1 peptide synthetase [Streptomyces triticagri]
MSRLPSSVQRDLSPPQHTEVSERPCQPEETTPYPVTRILGELAADPNSVLKAYTANAAFRAATAEELTTPDNPFRRPVRPDDLAWLDYAPVLPAERQLLLSGLLGHRMLRNVYDAENALLPGRADAAAAADGKQFRSYENRLLGMLARPVLENHLFAHLDDDRTELAEPTVGAVQDVVREYCERRTAEPHRAFATAAGRKDARSAATFLLIQSGVFLPAVHHAIGRGALAETTLAHPGLQAALEEIRRGWVLAAPDYRSMFEDAGLTSSPAAYWQFSLGTSLARGNHLLGLALAGDRLPEFLGAVTHLLVDLAASAAPLRDALRDALDLGAAYFDKVAAIGPQEAAALVERFLGPLPERFGDNVVTSFHRGFADAARIAARWDDDLTEQLVWADRIEDYKTAAEGIQHKLVTENIEVDLDTFVETHEETSTTHVHDEHRLVMVESGQMHFWNNVTHRIALSEGDKLLIPTSRLHGSVVLSGTCVYHQPIIPEEMFREFVTD